MPIRTDGKHRDVVCGIRLDGLQHISDVVFRGKTHRFCSSQCAKRFRSDPNRFLGTPLLQLVDVWKVFRNGGVETSVLRGLNLSVWDGDFVVIIGASGSGKSTALNMIGLLDRPTSGSVLLDGRDTAAFSEQERALRRSKTFGFIFQQYNLIPWLSAYENVTLPCVFAEISFRKEVIVAQFDQVGMKERMQHRPVQLSGGEQQRTALLRALSTNPRIILGDEPTGNLDSVTGAKIMDWLVELHHREKRTLVVVSHDPAIAERADQIITIKDGVQVQNHHVHRFIRSAV